MDQDDLEKIRSTLWDLLIKVTQGPMSSTYGPLQYTYDRRDMQTWHNRKSPPPLLQPRHWRPGQVATLEPTTQKPLELHLRSRRAERLTAHFAPYAEHLPNLEAVTRDSDFRMELKHLLGDARFRSIRQHCLVYENLRKRGFVAIPWRESDVRALLNKLQADEISPYKLQQIWQTLNWLSKIFGLLKVDEHQRLVTKKKALEEELAPTVVRPQKKAAVPSREVIWALEEGAALGGPPWCP